MKAPKNAIKSQEIIDNLVNLLRYYMSGTSEFRRIVREDVQFLENYLQEVSVDHKVHNIRFASKLKALWKKDLQEKESKIRELEEKIGELE